jgi:hypothetical protein
VKSGSGQGEKALAQKREAIIFFGICPVNVEAIAFTAHGTSFNGSSWAQSSASSTSYRRFVGKTELSKNAYFLSGKTYSTVSGIIKTADIARKSAAIISGWG